MKKWIVLASFGLLTAMYLPAGAADSAQQERKEQSKQYSDEDFVTEAASGGLAEVELGRYAAENASNDAVRKFGQSMVTDHTKANEDLKKAASDKKLTVPTEMQKKHQEAVAKLEKLKGAEFDKEYVKAMVMDHIEDVNLFQNEADNGKTHEIKKFAKSTLPTLQHHLHMAQALNKEIGGEAITAGGKEIGSGDTIAKHKDEK